MYSCVLDVALYSIFIIAQESRSCILSANSLFLSVLSIRRVRHEQHKPRLYLCFIYIESNKQVFTFIFLLSSCSTWVGVLLCIINNESMCDLIWRKWQELFSKTNSPNVPSSFLLVFRRLILMREPYFPHMHLRFLLQLLTGWL